MDNQSQLVQPLAPIDEKTTAFSATTPPQPMSLPSVSPSANSADTTNHRARKNYSWLWRLAVIVVAVIAFIGNFIVYGLLPIFILIPFILALLALVLNIISIRRVGGILLMWLLIPTFLVCVYSGIIFIVFGIKYPLYGSGALDVSSGGYQLQIPAGYYGHIFKNYGNSSLLISNDLSHMRASNPDLNFALLPRSLELHLGIIHQENNVGFYNVFSTNTSNLTQDQWIALGSSNFNDSVKTYKSTNVYISSNVYSGLNGLPIYEITVRNTPSSNVFSIVGSVTLTNRIVIYSAMDVPSVSVNSASAEINKIANSIKQD
jgi:hypothetical protein